jgi:hypothetical protein
MGADSDELRSVQLAHSSRSTTVLAPTLARFHQSDELLVRADRPAPADDRGLAARLRRALERDLGVDLDDVVQQAHEQAERLVSAQLDDQLVKACGELGEDVMVLDVVALLVDQRPQASHRFAIAPLG